MTVAFKHKSPPIHPEDEYPLKLTKGRLALVALASLLFSIGAGTLVWLAWVLL